MSNNNYDELSTEFHDLLNNSVGIKAGINLLRKRLKENDNSMTKELIVKIDKEFENGLNNWDNLKKALS